MPTIKRRVAVNLADGEYHELAALAERHSVSMAWLGRQALIEFMERYREESLQLPLPFRTSALQAREGHASRSTPGLG